MMPRSTSVVPPWIVSLGAVLMANESWFSSVSRLVAFSSTKAARSRTRCGNCCSQTVPMSFTIEASTTGSLPACSMPATDTDMRRMVCTCATSRPMPSAEHVIVRHEIVGEHDLVEFELPGDLADRIHLDARLLHLDQELGQAVTAV